MIVFRHVSIEMLSPKPNARDNIPSHFLLALWLSIVAYPLSFSIKYNMIQLKVFYNISFPGDRCELITGDENEVSTFDDLMRIVRNTLECLPGIQDLPCLFM